GLAELHRDVGDAIPPQGEAMSTARMRIARERASAPARAAVLAALEAELADAPGEGIALAAPLRGALRLALDGDFAGAREVAVQIVERARDAIERLAAREVPLAERVRLVREIDH